MENSHGSSPDGDTHREAETAVVSGHTPGPWFARKAHSGIWDVFAGDRDVVTVMGGGIYPPANEANARLIAAAPEMAGDGAFLLDRLTDFENLISTDEDAREFHGHVAPAIARFRAAIAKATGQ